MNTPPPTPDPADRSDFGPAERALARAVLLELRTGRPVSLPAGLVGFQSGESLEWCRTPEGGQARRVPGTTTLSQHTLSYQSHPEAAGPWFPCPQPPRYQPPPELDATVEGPPPD